MVEKVRTNKNMEPKRPTEGQVSEHELDKAKSSKDVLSDEDLKNVAGGTLGGWNRVKN